MALSRTPSSQRSRWTLPYSSGRVAVRRYLVLCIWGEAIGHARCGLAGHHGRPEEVLACEDCDGGASAIIHVNTTRLLNYWQNSVSVDLNFPGLEDLEWLVEDPIDIVVQGACGGEGKMRKERRRDKRGMWGEGGPGGWGGRIARAFLVWAL